MGLDPLAREIAGVAYLLSPLLVAALLHGLCLAHGWLGFLARPIDAGRTLRGRPLFGHSKRWRGPIVVAAGAGLAFALQRSVLHGCAALASIELVDYAALPGYWLGALAGAAAELAELPNSFVKRQLDIAPGKTARGPLAVVFYLWDQLDLLAGYWLVFGYFVPPTPSRVAVSMLLVGGLHPVVTVIGYLLGMRPTAR